MDYMDWLFLAMALIPLVVGTVYWRLSRSRQVLKGWARDKGYKIISSRYCWFWRGPFLLRSTEGQAVYYVTVADREGQHRSGYVRCGGFLLGILSNRVDVQWDDKKGRLARIE